MQSLSWGEPKVKFYFILQFNEFDYFSVEYTIIIIPRIRINKDYLVDVSSKKITFFNMKNIKYKVEVYWVYNFELVRWNEAQLEKE